MCKLINGLKELERKYTDNHKPKKITINLSATDQKCGLLHGRQVVMWEEKMKQKAMNYIRHKLCEKMFEQDKNV